MVEQTEGTYKVAITPPSTSGVNYFAVFQGINSTNFDDATRYTPENQENQDVDTKGTYNMQVGTDGVWVLNGNNGTYTVVVDPRDQAESTISFDWGDSTGEANILINDRTDTGYDSKSYKMEALADTDDDDYTWSGTIGAEDEVMFNIHGVTYSYTPSIGEISEDETTGNLVIVYPLSDENPNYVRFDYDANVTYNVNISKKTVTLIQTDPAPATINITKANGASGIHRMEPVTGGKGSYATIHPITFEVGDRVDFRLGDKRYNPEFAEATMLAEGAPVPFTLVEADDTSEAPLWKGSDDATPVYVRINEDLSGQVQPDVPTAVKTIDAADEDVVYFNLQGIRVANPENGIFIVKKGAKTTKVVL